MSLNTSYKIWKCLNFRISDYKHHSTDVLAGVGMGSMVAVTVSLFLLNLRDHPAVFFGVDHHERDQSDQKNSQDEEMAKLWRPARPLRNPKMLVFIVWIGKTLQNILPTVQVRNVCLSNQNWSVYDFCLLHILLWKIAYQILLGTSNVFILYLIICEMYMWEVSLTKV